MMKVRGKKNSGEIELNKPNAAWSDIGLCLDYPADSHQYTTLGCVFFGWIFRGVSCLFVSNGSH